MMFNNSELQFDSIYDDLIMDHYRNPRNRNPINRPDIDHHDWNPFCGDEVYITFEINKDSQISSICVVAQGCSILQASASIMSTGVLDQRLSDVLSLFENFKYLMETSDLNACTEISREMSALRTIRKYPVRIKCVMLPWVAMRDAVKIYLSG